MEFPKTTAFILTKTLVSAQVKSIQFELGLGNQTFQAHFNSKFRLKKLHLNFRYCLQNVVCNAIIFRNVSCVVCLMIAAFYFPRGVIIRTNMEGSKASVDKKDK